MPGNLNYTVSLVNFDLLLAFIFSSNSYIDFNLTGSKAR